VALGGLTTLEIGGPARFFVEAGDGASVAGALGWAGERKIPAVILGGGSNVVVADRGMDGLVIRTGTRGLQFAQEGSSIRITVGAGESWDEVVERAVAKGLAGLECLSGIPGTVGATPIQNVGAYGQEVAEVIESVQVVDRRTLGTTRLTSEELGFGYRSSVLRSDPGRFVVLAVTYLLKPGGPATVRYPELARLLEARGPASPTLGQVRAAVLELRRSKSMVIDAADENRRSVGSFFVNPILDRQEVDEVERRAASLGVTEPVPLFPADLGGMKIPAAWLIERAGFRKGHTRGRVGISTRHSLALVNRGGATATELIVLAREIRDAVRDRFGIVLNPEPVFLGFAAANPLDEREE